MNRSTLAIIASWIAAIALALLFAWTQQIDADDAAALQAQIERK